MKFENSNHSMRLRKYKYTFLGKRFLKIFRKISRRKEGGIQRGRVRNSEYVGEGKGEDIVSDFSFGLSNLACFGPLARDDFELFKLQKQSLMIFSSPLIF